MNVFARLDASPLVVFSTHFDCVPPFFESREQRGLIFGRSVMSVMKTCTFTTCSGPTGPPSRTRPSSARIFSRTSGRGST